MKKLIAQFGALACIAASALPVGAQPVQSAVIIQPGIGVGLGKNLGLRLQHQVGNTERGTAVGIDLRAAPKLDSFSLLGDWHPRATGLRVTAGVVASRNRLDAAAPLALYEAAGVASRRYASPMMHASLSRGHADPYLGLGWSKLPSRGKGLGFYADAGVLFQHPRTGLTATSSLSAAEAPAEQHEPHRSTDSRHRYNPVLSVGLSYGF